jgi:hypothetical protein
MSRLRMERRSKVITFTPVYNQSDDSLLGYLEDLTMRGALMISEAPVPVDQNLTLGIEFRKTADESVKRLTIPARVAWCKHDDHRTYYNTGLEFLELSEKDKNAVAAILEKYKFSREKPAKKAVKAN